MKRSDAPRPLLLSRPLAVADIPPRGRDIKVEASAGERDRIAAAFELAGLEQLTGAFHLRAAGEGARLEGEVEAQIRQICVVSLEPFDTRLSEKVDLRFVPEPRSGQAFAPPAGEITISLEEEDPPEPIVDGRIDLGAVMLEFLALGIDPYPRKPGVELGHGNVDEEKTPSHFAALAGYGAKAPDKK
jgi:Large ribosomal RNA subunit accumulation protein YceD